MHSITCNSWKRTRENTKLIKTYLQTDRYERKFQMKKHDNEIDKKKNNFLLRHTVLRICIVCRQTHEIFLITFQTVYKRKLRKVMIHLQYVHYNVTNYFTQKT